jgi:hypothetical protein
MHLLAGIVGAVVISLVFLDAFETIVLPRRVQRQFRLTSWFYRNTWVPWLLIARVFRNPSRREVYLSYFGPLSLIMLLVYWALSLIFGFAMLQYGVGEHISMINEPTTFRTLLYHSGETFFTLGYGDIVPKTFLARMLAVAEAGTGFAFLGIVIGYLPVVYSAFAKRETEISLLDTRAGSPPTAAEFMLRMGKCSDPAVLDRIFIDWERWAAGLLADHLSYPALSFFRSQHGNQSWLGALTVMLDVTSLVVAGVEGIPPEQAHQTFAMARHAAVDLAQVIHVKYGGHRANRLPPEKLQQLRETLAAAGIRVRTGSEADAKLAKMRSLYEPYVEETARRLQLTIPPWSHSEKKRDNWQGGPWDLLIQARALGEGGLAVGDDHF